MNYRNVRVNVIDELFLPNCNTTQACEEFVNHTQKYAQGRTLQVICYGDATGSRRQTAGGGSHSDWQAVREYFARHPGYNVTFRYKTSNPLVKDRVAAVNGALCNSVGERKLFINPRCKSLQRDLERVTWTPGTAQLDKPTPGELEKAKLDQNTDKQLTHISDALGYLIETEMPARAAASFRREMVV
jgi:hypothetical protein